MDALDFLDGMKTFIGGLILVAGGAAGMGFGLIDPATGVTLIGNGFAVWGIGGKVEKLAKSLSTPTKEPAFHVEPPTQ